MLTYASEIWTQYPNGASVYDRQGRHIRAVMACNLQTGEVIRYDPKARKERHGFWPAPLTIKPRQWLHIGFDNH
jgi:hypothetical protein